MFIQSREFNILIQEGHDVFVMKGLVCLHPSPFQCGEGTALHIQANRKSAQERRWQAVRYKIISTIDQGCNRLIHQRRINQRTISADADNYTSVMSPGCPVETFENIVYSS